MKKSILSLVLVICVILFMSKAYATTTGAIFTSVKEPVSVSAADKGTKSASSSNISILSLFGFGDSSIDRIAKSGGITQVKYVEKQTSSFLFLFTQETFTVYGD
ncbi:MAG: TRL domain-containing protein [Candidatus Margulisiibacteriota bacterium]|jgi:hypothetical protein